MDDQSISSFESIPHFSHPDDTKIKKANAPSSIHVSSTSKRENFSAQDIEKHASIHSIVSKGKKIRISRVDNAAKGELKKLSIQESGIESQLNIAECIDSKISPSCHQWMKKLAKEVVQEIIKDIRKDPQKEFKLVEQFKDGATKLATPLVSPVGIVQNLGNRALRGEYIMNPHFGLRTDLFLAAAEVELAILVPKSLGQGALLIYQRTIIAEAKKQLSQKRAQISSVQKEQKTKLRQDILLLEKWITSQEAALDTQSEQLRFTIATTLPRISYQVLIGIGKTQTLIGYFSWFAAGGASVVVTAKELYNASQNLQLQKKWIEQLTSNEGKSAIAQLLKTRKESLEQKTQKYHEAYYQSRQAILNKIQSALDLPESDQVPILNELTAELAKQGIPIEKLNNGKQVQHLTTLRALLSDSHHYFNGLSLYTQHQENAREAFSVTLCNGLKTLALEKQKIEKKFLNFRLTKSKIMFSLTALAFSITIILKILASVTLVSSAIGLSVSGVGLFAVGFILMLVGIYFLYKMKPNLFNTYLGGTQIRLAFQQIPLAIQQYRLSANILKYEHHSEAIRLLEARKKQLEGLTQQIEPLNQTNLPEKLRPLLPLKEKQAEDTLKEARVDAVKAKKLVDAYHQELKKKISQYKIEQEKIVDRFKDIETKAKKYDEGVKRLQKEITEAGWKDYKQIVGEQFFETSKPYLSQKEAPPTFALLLAEEIINHESFLTDEPIAELLGKLNIDVNKIRNLPDKDSKMREVSQAIETFFALEDQEMIKLIKQQSLQKQKISG